MFDALIFSTVNALEFHEVRRNVIRIPEVIQKVREAQALWDQHSERSFDLANFIGSDDSGFLGNLRLKNLATAVVQLGLLDRWLKHNELPTKLAGLNNGDSAVQVASRQQTFEEMVVQSHAVAPSRQPLFNHSSLPVLAGISLAEFCLLELEEHGFEPRLEKEMDMRKILATMAAQQVRRIVVVGPGAGHLQALANELKLKLEIVDSIACDPVLSWFWGEREQQRPSAAI